MMDYEISAEYERTMRGIRADNMATEIEKKHMARELMGNDIREILANGDINTPVKIKHTCKERWQKLKERIKTVFG